MISYLLLWMLSGCIVALIDIGRIYVLRSIHMRLLRYHRVPMGQWGTFLDTHSKQIQRIKGLMNTGWGLLFYLILGPPFMIFLVFNTAQVLRHYLRALRRAP